LYRWHATTSEADEKYVEELMGSILHGQSTDKVSRTLGESVDVFMQCGLQLGPRDFIDAAGKFLAKEPDITRWTFGEWVA
jgi:hypothetical protein